jgi:hypothetical protein
MSLGCIATPTTVYSLIVMYRLAGIESPAHQQLLIVSDSYRAVRARLLGTAETRSGTRIKVLIRKHIRQGHAVSADNVRVVSRALGCTW